MMKRIMAIVSMAALACMLWACTGGTLSVDIDEVGTHAVAEGFAEGSGTGNVTIGEGQGLCVNHIVERGSFHVKATSSDGEVVFDEDLTDNIANLVEVPAGEYDLVISAKNATGTVDVIAYDIEAQAMADATLDDALERNGVDAEKLGLDK